MRWLLLALAIVFEIVGTSFMKASYGMTRLTPTVVMGISYLFCFVFLSLSLKRIDVGIAYAIWSGIREHRQPELVQRPADGGEEAVVLRRPLFRR